VRVRVEFYGPLADEYRNQAVEVLPGTDRVVDVLDRLGVEQRYFAVLFDTDPVDFQTPIRDNIRTIMLVPPIGGGCL